MNRRQLALVILVSVILTLVGAWAVAAWYHTRVEAEPSAYDQCILAADSFMDTYRPADLTFVEAFDLCMDLNG